MRTMRLNLGCGPIYRKGFLNIDAFDRSVADLLCSLTPLPFKDETFGRIEGHHIIEHLGYIEALYAMSECFRVARTDAAFVLETPDIEASFKTFLKDETVEGRSSLLTWIFGLDTPGQSHKMLYPSKLLALMMKDAGFRKIRLRRQKTHLYREGLRIRAVRSGESIYKVLSRLRHKVMAEGIVDTKDHLQALEFERKFIPRIRRFHRNPRKNRELIFRNLVYSPAAVLKWLEAYKAEGYGAFAGYDDLVVLSGVLMEISFPLRLIYSFNKHIESPAKSGDAYKRIFSKGKKLVEKLAGKPRSDIILSVMKVFPGRSGGSAVMFSRRHMESIIWGMRDRAVRLMAREKYSEAARLLRLSINSGIDGFYSTVNYAILNALFHKYGEATSFYKIALAFEPGERLETLISEETVKCFLRSSEFSGALKAAGEMKNKAFRSFWFGVILYHKGEMTGCRRRMERLSKAGFRHELLRAYFNASGRKTGRALPLPALRVEPLPAGEGIHHNLE